MTGERGLSIYDSFIPASAAQRRKLRELAGADEDYGVGPAGKRATARALVQQGLAEPVVVLRLTGVGRRVVERMEAR